MKKKVSSVEVGDVILVDLPTWVTVMSVEEVEGNFTRGNTKLYYSNPRPYRDQASVYMGSKVEVECMEFEGEGPVNEDGK